MQSRVYYIKFLNKTRQIYLQAEEEGTHKEFDPTQTTGYATQRLITSPSESR